MNPRIPRPVFFFGIVVLLADVYIASTALFSPAEYSPDAVANAQTQLMWAGRVVAMLFVLAVAIGLRSAPLLAAALGMRAIAETFDAIAFLRAGSSIGYVVVVMALLELTAMIWLVHRMRAPAGVSAGSRSPAAL